MRLRSRKKAYELGDKGDSERIVDVVGTHQSVPFLSGVGLWSRHH